MTDEEIERALASLNLSEEDMAAAMAKAEAEIATAKTGKAAVEETVVEEPVTEATVAAMPAVEEPVYMEEALQETVSKAYEPVVEEPTYEYGTYNESASDAEANAESTTEEVTEGAAEESFSSEELKSLSELMEEEQGMGEAEESDIPKEKKRFFNFSTKLVMLCVLPMLVVCIVTVVISVTTLRNSIETEIQKSMKIVASTLDETYNNLYEGDYHKSLDGAVYKGEKKISGDNKLLNSILENTGFYTTMFWENSRLITTVKNEKGAPANGTKVDKELWELIKADGGTEQFIKGTELFGVDYYVYYMPMKNEDGSVMGAFGVCLESEAIEGTVNSQIVKLIGISVVIMVVVAVLILLLSRRMVATMRKTKEFLGKIAAGVLTDTPEEKVLKQNDELGDIYGMSVSLQTELRKIVNHIKDSVEDLNLSANQLTDMAQETKGSVDTVFGAVEEINNGTVTQAEGTQSASTNVEKIGQQIGYITGEVDSLTRHAKQMSDAEKKSEQIIANLFLQKSKKIIIFTGVKIFYLTPVFFCVMISKVAWKECVMEKIVQQGILYDFYGDLLTEHQRQIYEDAVFNDMSLSELANVYDISRQGVHDLLKRCDKILEGYEEKLHLVERFHKIKETVKQIEQTEDLMEARALAADILEEL